MENFKGVRDETHVYAGQDCEVVGDNATGKTTQMDAHLWVLTGKDSLEQADFDIKPLDADNVPIPGRPVCVTATYTDNEGHRLTLSRTYKEKHVAKRAKGGTEFSGHTTDYTVNSVPVQESEYRAKVAEFFGGNEAMIRLLGDPIHAAGRLKWTVLRDHLVKLSGDVTLDQVIERYPNLAELPKILGEHSIEDKRKIIKGEKDAATKRIEEIPVQLSEVQRGIGEELQTVNTAPLQKALAELLDRKAAASTSSTIAEKRTEIAEKRTEIAKLETSMAELRTELTRAANAGHTDASARLRAVASTIGALTIERDNKLETVEANKVKIEKSKARLSELSESYKKIRADQFEFAGETSCAACGQDLPAEKVAEATAKAEAAFNERKAKELAENMEEGKQFKTLMEGWTSANEQHLAKIKELDLEIQAHEVAKGSAELAVKQAELPTIDVESDPDYANLIHKVAALKMGIAAIEDEITRIQSESTPLTADLQKQIDAQAHLLAEAQATNARAEAQEKAKARLAQLAAEQKSLASQVEKLTREAFLIEEFIRARVSMLEANINDKFAVTKFRLFEIQINGGINEVCEALLCGIPYASMNTAGRINVGLDIINVLGAHYGLRHPIFVDHCESNTRPLPTDAQQIRLIVAKGKALELTQTTKELVTA